MRIRSVEIGAELFVSVGTEPRGLSPILPRCKRKLGEIVPANVAKSLNDVTLQECEIPSHPR